MLITALERRERPPPAVRDLTCGDEKALCVCMYFNKCVLNEYKQNNGLQPWLHTEFETSLSYTVLKKNKQMSCVGELDQDILKNEGCRSHRVCLKYHMRSQISHCK